MDQALFDATAARIKHTFTTEIDRNLPEWARRSNPIVRRHLGSYWKTLTPDMHFILRVYLAQVGLILVSFLAPVLFVLLMPTVTLTLVLLPIGIVVYGQILYQIGESAAISIVKEHRNETLDLLLIIPRPASQILLSKVAAAVWRRTENLSLILIGAALASLPLMIIQYDVYFSLDNHPILMRLALIAALAVSILRVIIEPIMVGALGVMVGTAVPSRLPALVGTTTLTAAYFLLINLARLVPTDFNGRLLIEIFLPLVLPLLITWGAFRAAAYLLIRD